MKAGLQTQASDDAEEPLIPKETRVYFRRWYVLAVFSSACFLQALVWNTWGPITQSSEVVFDWKDSQIGMLANWGNIAYIITVFPACYFLDTKGLRISLLACTFLMLLGCGFRCITYSRQYATWFMNICAILNGIAGTVPFAGPAQLASIWFPPNQRTTATAIASIFNYAGVGLAFVIGPQLVSTPVYKNITRHAASALESKLSFTTDPSDYVITNGSVLMNFDRVRNDIMNLMYYECGAAGIIFLCCLLYLPAKPPIPPSNSASIQRTEYAKALLQIGRNKSLWLMAIAYAIPAGVYGVWGATIDVILKPLGLDQDEVGWIGFYSIMAGCASAFVIARFSDIFMKHMKLFLLLMYGSACGSFVWFTLICEKIIPFSTVQVYVSSILGGMFLNGAIPLFYELGAESAYPVSEGVVGGFLTWLNNLAGIMFLLVLLIPKIGTAWMNWTLVGSVGLGLMFLFIFPERYTRTDIDIKVDCTDPDHVQTNVTEHQHVYENDHVIES